MIATNKVAETELLQIEVLSSTTGGHRYPFREVLAILSAFEDILESSIEVVSEETGLPKRLRPRLEILGQQPRVGSYYQELSVLIDWGRTAVPATGMALSQLTPGEIFRGGKYAVDLLKWVYSRFAQQSKVPSVSSSDNRGTLIVAGDGAQIHVDNRTVRIAARTEDALIRIAEALDSGKIRYAKLSGASTELQFDTKDGEFASPGIRRAKPMRAILKELSLSEHTHRALSSELPDTRLRLRGEVVAFDKRTRRGSLRSEVLRTAMPT